MDKTSAHGPMRRSWRAHSLWTGLIVALVVVAAWSSLGNGADPFKKLTAAQIRAIVVGMDFTDDVHWAIQHFRDGTAKSFHMGTADTGKWRLDGDTLCVDYVKAGKECHEVWRSGGALQLRQTNSGTVLEGVLVQHQKRG